MSQRIRFVGRARGSRRSMITLEVNGQSEWGKCEPVERRLYLQLYLCMVTELARSFLLKRGLNILSPILNSLPLQ